MKSLVPPWRGRVSCSHPAVTNRRIRFPIRRPPRPMNGWSAFGGKRHGDCETYFHVGHAGEKFPSGVMRIVIIKHSNGTVEPAEEAFAFASAIGGKNYLNVACRRTRRPVERLNEKGWKRRCRWTATCSSSIEFDGDKLVMLEMDEGAVKQAIKERQGQGIMGDGSEKYATLTDTTENVARFVAAAGDSLWNTKNPGAV